MLVFRIAEVSTKNLKLNSVLFYIRIQKSMSIYIIKYI